MQIKTKGCVYFGIIGFECIFAFVKLIGTHNSATGEKARGLLSLLLAPIARCQTKTLIEQYEAGCRLFDLRVRDGKNGYYLCHWWFKTNRTLCGALGELNACNEKVSVMITYEGRCNDEKMFLGSVLSLQRYYPNVEITEVNIKKPIWRTIWVSANHPSYECGHVIFNKSDYRTLLPIPYVWDRICFQPHEFNEDKYIMCDFL